MEPTTSPAAAAYPVAIDVERPLRFERVQVALRLLVLLVLGLWQQSMGGLFTALYLLLPVTAAILISHRGSTGFLEEDSSWLGGLLSWVVALYAYLLFVTDRFPLDGRARTLRLTVAVQTHAHRAPDVGPALARLLMTLPHALALALLGCISGLVAAFAAIMVLFTEHYPGPLHHFQCDVVAWIARVLAYHSSLVEPYPPFSLDSRGSQLRNASLA